MMASDALRNTRNVLKDCPTQNYLFVNQRGMTTADFRRVSTNSITMTPLSHIAEDSRIQGKFLVSEVIGQMKDVSRIEDTGLVDFVSGVCGRIGKKHEVDILDLASLSADDQESALTRNGIQTRSPSPHGKSPS